MKLYAMPSACSMVPHTALEWTKAQYELKLVSGKDTKTPEYLKLNPQGAVPLLQEGEFVLSQNVAILEYLNAIYPEAKLFGTGDAKAQAKVWHFLAYLNSDVHKSFGPIFHPEGMLPKGEGKEDLVETAKQKLIKLMQYLNDSLNGQDYLTGELTIADVYMYVMLRWSKQIHLDLSHYANLAPFMTRMENNASVQAVLEQEKLKPLA